jgi:hypothetical protein
VGLPIPIIGGILDRLLGIGERLIPDKSKAQDHKHEQVMQQGAATVEGERNSHWTPRKILLLVFGIPAALQFAVKPTVEWVAAVFGYPLVLPGIDVEASLKILIGLLGLG